MNKEYGTPITLNELKGHYEKHFLSPEQFIELINDYVSQKIGERMKFKKSWTQTEAEEIYDMKNGLSFGMK